VTTADLRDQAAHLAAHLARQLVASGVLRGSEWDAAVRRVPRHVFVPSYVEQQPDLSWRTVSGADEDTRDEWLAAVYSDRALTTALRTDASGQAIAVSSSSKPGLMIRMLEALELGDKDRVLEIGTGTGYNVGLLCHRLGHGQVASVDIEGDLVAKAAESLTEIGFKPMLAATDGADGLPEAAPYDRIIATCSVPRIPTAWLEQVSLRGRVLTDVKITGAAGNLVDLRAAKTSLEGRFLPKWAGFMPLRSKAQAPTSPERRKPTISRTTNVPSANPWWDHPVVWFLAALHLPPGVVTGVRLDHERTGPVATTLHAADGSWADVTLGSNDDGLRVVRGSSPDMWRVVEDAYALWRQLGNPSWDRFGMTVTSESQQQVWFDSPNSPHVWQLPKSSGS